MKKILLSILAILIVVILSGYLFLQSSPQYTGTIIGVSDYEDKFTIWVIEDPSGIKEVKGKTKEEIAEMYRFAGTVYTIPKYVPDFILNKLEIGQKVKIYTNGRVLQSAPSQADAYWIEVID